MSVLPRFLALVQQDNAIVNFHTLQPGITRKDKGKDVRAKYVPPEIDVDTCTSKPPPDLSPNMYHKYNTQYVGSQQGLKDYEEFLANAPDFIDDNYPLPSSLHLKHGIVAGYKHDRSKRCQTCKKHTHVLKMHDGNICNICHLAQVVLCDKCHQLKPRGHKCNYIPTQLKKLGTLVKPGSKRLGRPCKREYWLIGNKRKCECPYCPPGTFIGGKSFSKHLKRKHSTDTPTYKCDCGYTCSVKTQFDRHLRSHSDERPFKCKFCDKRYKHSEGRSTHMRKKHPTKHRMKKIPKRKHRHRSGIVLEYTQKQRIPIVTNTSKPLDIQPLAQLGQK